MEQLSRHSIGTVGGKMAPAIRPVESDWTWAGLAISVLEF